MNPHTRAKQAISMKNDPLGAKQPKADAKRKTLNAPPKASKGFTLERSSSMKNTLIKNTLVRKAHKLRLKRQQPLKGIALTYELKKPYEKPLALKSCVAARLAGDLKRSLLFLKEAFRMQ